jgi:RimJ/RimL family protein N-acetyltransferase
MISIRLLDAEDHKWIFEACQDDEIQRFTYVPRPYTIEHAKEFAISQAGEYIVWVIQRSEEPIGVISIHDICDKTGVASIGYWIAPWGRRQGGASAAIALVVDYARQNPIITELQAKIADTNHASIGAAQRAGLSISQQACKACPDGELQVQGSVFSIQI